MTLSPIKSEWLGNAQYPEIAGSVSSFDGAAFKGAALAIKGISDLSASAGTQGSAPGLKADTLDA